MNQEVFVTCAVTGAGDTTGASDRVPVTPEADRRGRDRGGARGRGGRPHPRPRPRDRARRRATRRCTARSSSASRAAASTSCSTSPPAWAATSSSAATTRRCRPTPAGTDMVGAARAARPRRGAAPGDLHARLRHDELRRRRRLRHGQHARRCCGRWRERIRELGVRPELEVFDTGHLVMVKRAGPRRADRRPGADPALHGHPLRRAGRPARRCSRMVAPAAARRGVLGVLDRPHAAALRRARRARGRQRARRPRGQPLPLARRARHERAARRARRARSSRR